MKRILQIVGTMDRAGAETMVMNLYKAIDREKFQFDFLVFNNKKQDFENEIDELGGKIHKINSSNPLKRYLLTYRLLKKNKSVYNVVHCHTNFSNSFHLLAAYFVRIRKRVAHSHNTVDKSRNKYVSLIYHAIAKMFINMLATDYVSCGLEARKLLFYSNKKVLILPNSVDVNFLKEIAFKKQNFILNNFNIDKNDIKLLQVGRINEEKNHEFSLKVVKEIKNMGVELKFFIVGNGILKNKIVQFVEEYDLKENVFFLGIRDDVPNLMAGADVMIMPSHYEGFPVVLVESQAIGLPSLISSNISNEVDLGVNLVEFESLKESPKIWAHKLIELCERKKEEVFDGQNLIIEKGFDIKNNAKLLMNLYTN